MRPTARWLGPERLGALAAALLLSGAGGASAQSAFNPLRPSGEPPCVLDKCLHPKAATDSPSSQTAPDPQPAPNVAPRFPAGGSVASGAFDFYVLALSWSPGFCESDAGARAPRQCEPGAKLGFVVHGLWPQNQHGFPADCDTSAPPPSRLVLNQFRGLYPDEGLARHEWRAHGTCTGQSPSAYFADVRRARDAITIPPDFQAPSDSRSWAPLDIARAFSAANPRLRTDSMAVTCRQNALQEVRICFSKDLRGFTPCPEVARASCRRPIEVPPVL